MRPDTSGYIKVGTVEGCRVGPEKSAAFVPCGAWYMAFGLQEGGTRNRPSRPTRLSAIVHPVSSLQLTKTLTSDRSGATTGGAEWSFAKLNNSVIGGTDMFLRKFMHDAHLHTCDSYCDALCYSYRRVFREQRWVWRCQDRAQPSPPPQSL